MKVKDIPDVIEEFKKKSNVEDRYTSFDYCYNYFRQTEDLTKDIEKSCLVLGFYLASWGMFRGSSFLLKEKCAKYFEKTIQYIAELDCSVWKIDVDKYDEENIKKILSIYDEVRKKLVPDNTHLTLVTKVLLGVFGFVPAFDNYFRKAFKEISREKKCSFNSMNMKSLYAIKSFYDANKEAIDRQSKETFTTDFTTRQKTKINYPKAKIIDMYGFSVGLKNEFPKIMKEEKFFRKNAEHTISGV